MKIFVYTLREFDELPFFEKFSKQYGVEFGYTTQSPGPENYNLAKGYDAIYIITTPTTAEMIDAMKENGVKVISTRTIGYDHIDVKHAFEVGMGVTNVTYDPASVADYTIMLMLIACRKLRYIMDKANVQDYTLKGKLGREISKSTVGVRRSSSTCPDSDAEFWLTISFQRMRFGSMRSTWTWIPCTPKATSSPSTHRRWRTITT